MRRQIVQSLLVFATSASANAAVIFVDADQTTNPADGLSWATAFTDLQAAIDFASEEDQVWVAEGTYSPGPGASTFNIPPRISLYGGFDGVSPDFTSRDLVAHPTILDGAAAPSNAHHVVTMVNASHPTVLDGFVIRNGRINSTAAVRDGAGILLVADQSNCAPVISHCHIMNNEILASDGSDGNGAGIGMVVSDGGICLPVITECVIESNSAARRGGGVFVAPACHAMFTDCLFIANTASAGGGLGGGAVATTSESFVDIVGCAFWNNNCLGAGGAVSFQNAAASTIVDSLFAYNYTTSNANGGAVHATTTGTITIDRTGFVGNVARDGGALSLDFGVITVLNSIFSGNQATRDGGAVRSFTGDLINCTFAHNLAARNGGGIWSQAEVHNTIAWSNESTNTNHDNIYFVTAGSKMPSLVTYSNVEGGVPSDWGTTNLGIDPEFLDSDGVDDQAGTIDDDLRIAGHGVSPCLDAGDNARVSGVTWDFHRRQRLVDDVAATDAGSGSGPIVDIGAVEFPCLSYCDADLNDDGSVNFDDLNLVLLNWARLDSSCLPGDVDGSGEVNFDDLNRVLLRWGSDCTFPGIGL